MSRTSRLLGVLTVLHTLAGSLIAVSVRGPLLAIDDIAFLSMGRTIAGDGAAAIGAQPPYGVLYPVLLAPGWLFGLGESQMVVYAQVLNAVLGALLIPVLYLLVRRLTSAGESWAVVAALVGASLPAALLTGSIAWAERLLPLLVAIGLLGASMLHERLTPARIGVTIGAAVGLFAAHPRTGAVAVALIGVATVAAFQRTRRDLAVAATGVGIAGMVLAEWLRSRIADAAFGSTGTYDAGSLAERRGVEDVSDMLVHGGGTIAYLVIATAGVAVLGALVLLNDRWAAATWGAVLVGIVGVAGWFLTGVDRADAWLHGRYIEIMAPPLVALGVVAARNLPWRVAMATAAGAVIAAGLYGAWAGPGDNFGTTTRSPVMMLGTEVSGAPFGGNFFEVGAATSIGVLAGALLILAARYREEVLVIVAGALVAVAVWSGLDALDSLQQNSIVGQVQASPLDDEPIGVLVIDTDRVQPNLAAAVAYEVGLDRASADLEPGTTHLLLPADASPPDNARLVAEFVDGSVWALGG
ncbi:MAG: hypothetical protein AAF548_19425 [Actinomycetota bacterium]